MDPVILQSNATPSEQPKKYIRTLEGDIATLQSGGTPDLALFVEKSPSPAERLIEASPITPIQESTQLPPPTQEPVEAPAFKPKEPAPIETYESDFSDRIKETNASHTTVLAAEQDSGPMLPEAVSKPQSSRINLAYIFGGITLLVVGGVGMYFAYEYYSSSLAPVMIASTVSSPIFVDDREQISGVGATLLQAIEQSVTHSLASGTIRLLYKENMTTSDSVFSDLQMPAPDILLRNVNATGSMAGVINVGGDQSPFFILSAASYSDTFSGMLSWESHMPSDLNALFPAYPTPAPTSTVTVSTTTATTTTTVVAPSTQTVAAGFHDETVNNHDVRVYRDTKNRVVLLYGYWNQTTLVIARNASAFAVILQRLATSRTQ